MSNPKIKQNAKLCPPKTATEKPKLQYFLTQTVTTKFIQRHSRNDFFATQFGGHSFLSSDKNYYVLLVRLEPKPTSTWRSLFSFSIYFVLWFFNLAFVSGGLLFMSKHRTWQNVLTKTVTTKFAQRHNRNDFCNIFRWTQFLKFKQKKCYSFSFFSCSFRGTHSYVLFYFPVGHIF